ncbi:MAG: Xaa-Pro peptidase family protein [Acidobacteriia bacterium]|nr:Xaa-Pro peptidase family protein [Terriglobia bacterium]
MNEPFSNRQRALRTRLAAAGVDALVVPQAANWYYLTGFTGEAGALVISRKGTALITDGRFTTQAREETRGVRVVQQKGSLYESVGQWLRGSRDKRIGYDPGALSVEQFRGLRRAAGKARTWLGRRGLVEGLRACKEAGELARMRQAALLAGKVLEGVLGLLKPGVRELEIAGEIEYQMRREGASGAAFESIVAFGERTALPHARPSPRKLGKNELVVLDLGAILAHYCSDITRTVYVGRAPKRIRGWYQGVLEAQQAAIATAQAGVECGEVDAAARRVLAGYGLDRRFVHSTGHGLGLEVHEEPRVARGQKQRLAPGNVVTIEPGVYVAGVGGIRIEDDVAVHLQSTEVLTRIPRDLIEL